ncbi:MAG: ORF6N domain-containing protein [Candidatus Cloacimonadota bacterium]|nr:ORF6N domain-containing protein [Candidatus Cloacimonadota bacterium]
MEAQNSIIPIEIIEKKIFFLRGKKVMLDSDLAELYEVETKQLKRAVRRNIERFPKDFMFVLTKEEFNNLRCNFGTSSWGGTRYFPMAFTEQGVAMLSSVLKSKRAIKVNIQIMRTFVRLRKLISSHKDILAKIEEMEKKYDYQFKIVFEAIRQMMTPPEKVKRDIGFKVGK